MIIPTREAGQRSRVFHRIAENQRGNNRKTTTGINDKRDAAYAVAKQKCDAFADDVKATCIKDAKVRYGQS